MRFSTIFSPFKINTYVSSLYKFLVGNLFVIKLQLQNIDTLIHSYHIYHLRRNDATKNNYKITKLKLFLSHHLPNIQKVYTLLSHLILTNNKNGQVLVYVIILAFVCPPLMHFRFVNWNTYSSKKKKKLIN